MKSIFTGVFAVADDARGEGESVQETWRFIEKHTRQSRCLQPSIQIFQFVGEQSTRYNRNIMLLRHKKNMMKYVAKPSYEKLGECE